jgi:hypothetical protein
MGRIPLRTGRRELIAFPRYNLFTAQLILSLKLVVSNLFFLVWCRFNLKQEAVDRS